MKTKNLIYGIGFSSSNEIRKSFRDQNGRQIFIKEYRVWKEILRRCYSRELKEKFPTYENCTASENFIDFDYFYNWCHEQKGFGIEGFEIDKDVLYKNNKVYSEDRCVFIPKELNLFFISKNQSNRSLPIGVTYEHATGRYKTQLSYENKKQTVGYFNNVIDAFKAYKKAKEEVAKKLAMKYLSTIDDRVIEKLVSYSIDLDEKIIGDSK